ncbi:hypothetical protein PRK78_003462 [Emydomyces testavorans]|uniref:Mucoidy inhibitor A n=1 Tax=Emydomyces testavorans TaxID=2070801 RepID=A0AAF0DIZ3_9EURO|nr:hypothetical protein PRK78_003462 [Emydomyces testavorans]
MVSEGVHAIEISLRDTVTKSVNLAPSSATIVREISDVEIKPGPNEITIYGFDPSVDPQSIQITGNGPATITDTQTSVVARKEKIEDIFPELKFDDDEESLDEEDSDDDFGIDKTELTKAENARIRLEDQLETAKNDLHTSEKSKKYLEEFGKTMKAGEIEVSKVEEYLSLYQQENKKLALQGQKTSATIKELEKELKTVVKLKNKLQRRFDHARNAAAKPEREKREQKRTARQQKHLQKERERSEMMCFWTLQVAQLVVHLDGFGDVSPDSSRRNSIASMKKRESTANSGPHVATLSLTYVTRNASWSPRYELNLTTPSSSGKVVYRAEYRNYSSEVWKDVKIILSTSQTTFSGVNETIPVLRPWTVKLLKYDSQIPPSKSKSYWQEGLENRLEVEARNKNTRTQHVQAFHSIYPSAPPTPPAPQSQFYTQPLGNRVRTQAALIPNFAGAAADLDEFQDFSVPLRRVSLARETQGGYSSQEDETETMTLDPRSNTLAFQESLQQDYGLTTTYDIPGVRTLRPSSVTRRLVITELELPSVNFSHIVIPKLRPAAFLKAKMINTSSTTFLRGDAGLTLDGTFLGTTSIPDCGPNGTASLSLGVDPGIQVRYAKPMVRRATTGFFNKEDFAVFTRVCRISNTKSTLVSLLVLDQVPISEDERLRIRILEPKGLEKQGDKAKIGSEVATSKAAWGKGTVSMEKAGEIKWELKLEKGAEIKLTLEYEARIPSGQKIAGLD